MMEKVNLFLCQHTNVSFYKLFKIKFSKQLTLSDQVIRAGAKFAKNARKFKMQSYT
jgi:hypothetical protein